MAACVILVQQSGDPFIDAVASFAHRESDWRLIAFSERSLPGTLALYPQARGAIAHAKQPGLERHFAAARLPWINVHHEGAGAPHVTSDLRAVGRLAAEHLGACGADTLACAADQHSALGAGFAAHATTAVHWAPRGRAFAGWLQKQRGTCALLAPNDGEGVACINAAHDAGRQVPGDLAICGVNNNRAQVLCAAVPLTSIDLDIPAMAITAARLLFAHLEHGRPIPARTLVPPKAVVPRRSTDVMHALDPLLHSALAFMEQAADEGITVDDVIAQCATSRSSLERRFHQRFQISPGAWLRRRRLDLACEQLRRTDLPTATIAARCGFSSPSVFARAFRAAFGCSPSAWQRDHR